MHSRTGVLKRLGSFVTSIVAAVSGSASKEPVQFEVERRKSFEEVLREQLQDYADLLEALECVAHPPCTAQAPADAEAGRDEGANCHRCGHYELSFARAERELAHCPSCGKHTRWLAAERAERGREAMSEPRRRAEGGAA